MMTESLRALFLAPGEGDRLVFNGDRAPHAGDCEGYILEGTCRFYVGGEVVTATQGAFVSIPRGVTPGFMPVGGGGHALVMFTPAAMQGL